MYEYKFVKLEKGFLMAAPKGDYRGIIARHAKEGWRFVQIFAPATSGYGSAAYFELIFEKLEE